MKSDRDKIATDLGIIRSASEAIINTPLRYEEIISLCRFIIKSVDEIENELGIDSRNLDKLVRDVDKRRIK